MTANTPVDEIILLDDHFAVVTKGAHKGKYGRVEEIPYTDESCNDQVHIRLSGLWSVRVNRDNITPITKAEFQDMRFLATQ